MKRLVKRISDVRSIVSACLLIFSLSSPVPACLNEVGRSTVGEPIYVDGLTADEFLAELKTHQDKKYWTSVLSELHRGSGHLSRDEMNNKAVAMLHLGQVRDAIAILEKLERDRPGL